MAEIQIEPLVTKASWLHCYLCGSDDQLASDWLITVNDCSQKFSKVERKVTVCDDCLRDVARVALEALQVECIDELYEDDAEAGEEIDH